MSTDTCYIHTVKKAESYVYNVSEVLPLFLD